MGELPASKLSRYGTAIYIGCVGALSLGLAFACQTAFGWPRDWIALSILAFLGALTWWFPSTSSDGRLRFTADNVFVLVAIPIVGPLGAGMVGLAMAGLERRRIQLHRRFFNAAMSSSVAMAGGIGYHLAGGAVDVASLHGAADLAWHVGLPIVVADAVHILVNALLVAGVIRISAGVPFRLQLVDMLTSSGLTQFAYGIIAFVMVIMWLPGELGPVAVLVGLAPLVGARWALLQYGEERDARERALGALVTAIETRAPALEGHSERVSNMAALVAQELGLGPKEVGDVRTAGLLHDLGRVVVAPGHEGSDQAASAALRGAAMLQTLPFLAGASSVMEEVARADSPRTQPSMAADIVRLADEYDLLLHGDEALSSSSALSTLRTRKAWTPSTDRVLGALAHVVRPRNGAGEAEVAAR